MTPGLPLTPRNDEPAGSSAAAASWAGDMAEAPKPTEARLPPQLQMALFPADVLAPAPATARRGRLAGPFKALLTAIEGPATRSRKPKKPAPSAGRATSSWPDSFFDVPPSS